MTRFQRWALATTTATYVLIAVGGLVRASESGLGCPDWPKCFDRWVPPLDVRDVPPHIDPAKFNVVKAWTEYINRGIGVVTGLLIITTLFLAIRHHRRDPRVLWPTAAATLLVMAEGVLGGAVVASELKPIVLSAHLALALIIGGLLLYATVCAFFDGGRPIADLPPVRAQLGRWAIAAGAVALVQVTLGAVIRGKVQLVAKVVPPIPREAWLGHVGGVYSAHTALAVLVLALVAYVVWRTVEAARGDRRIVGPAWVSLGVVVAQPITGLALSMFDVPPTFQVLHMWLGSLLVAALMVLAIACFRAPVSR